MTHVVRLTLQYAGTAYAGWQVQPGTPTIQGTVEAALGKLFDGDAPRLHGAGRTDAGVHARAQIAHFETVSPLTVESIRGALNHLLPWDIRVVEAAYEDPGFHARRSAVAKEYRYRIHRGPALPPDVYPYAVLAPSPLDLEAMRAASARILGRHDFAAFRSAGSSARTAVRTVLGSEWLEAGPELVYRIEADGFLYKMVRTIVGTLLEVGRGRRDESHVADLIRSRDRALAGPVAPARGLHLWSVRYPEASGSDCSPPTPVLG